jgi:hypothetical protein
MYRTAVGWATSTRRPSLIGFVTRGILHNRMQTQVFCQQRARPAWSLAVALESLMRNNSFNSKSRFVRLLASDEGTGCLLDRLAVTVTLDAPVGCRLDLCLCVRCFPARSMRSAFVCARRAKPAARQGYEYTLLLAWSKKTMYESADQSTTCQSTH